MECFLEPLEEATAYEKDSRYVTKIEDIEHDMDIIIFLSKIRNMIVL